MARIREQWTTETVGPDDPRPAGAGVRQLLQLAGSAAVKKHRLWAAVRPDQDQSLATNLNPAVRFNLEAYLESLSDVLDTIDEKRPELFRQTERGRDLLDNLQILLNGYTMN